MDEDNVTIVDDEAVDSEGTENGREDHARPVLGELLDLTDVQERRLKTWLKKRIQEWEDDTSELHRRLEEDNDLVEGVVDETDFPWPGCSNVHVDITGIYMRVFNSTFKRSILGAGTIWTAALDTEAELSPEGVGELREGTANVESLLNDKALHEWNIGDNLKGVIWTACRDGLAAMQVTWVEDYEPAKDTVLLTGIEDFFREFPNPKDAGMEDEEWLALAEKVEAEASVEAPYEVEVEFERRTYYGNKGDLVELADFVTFPATCPDITRDVCQGYGKRFGIRKGALRRKAREGIYYQDAVDRLLRKRAGGEPSSYKASKDWVEGLSRSGTQDLELFEMAVWFPLEGKDKEEKHLLITYSKDENEILAVTDYPYRVDFYALFRLEKRPGRLIGPSIPQATRDLNDEVDTQHNQRINTRTISTVPSFLADKGLKTELDFNKEENRWRPGVVFWLSDVTKFQQFKVQPTDLGESLQEEANDLRLLDLRMGASVALMSGQPNTQDANAPGNKTAMLINQSNLRLDDPLDVLREGVERVGQICLSHLYQFGPPIIKFMVDGPGGVQERSIHKKILRRGIVIRMKAVTVADNPDAEMAKRFQVHQMCMAEPAFAQDMGLRVESLRDVLRAGRVQDRDRLLPPPQAILQKQIEVQKAAMIQMEQEKAMAEAKAQADAVKARLAAAAQEERIKATAARAAESGLQLEPAPTQGQPGGLNGA